LNNYYIEIEKYKLFRYNDLIHDLKLILLWYVVDLINEHKMIIIINKKYKGIYFDDILNFRSNTIIKDKIN